MEYVFDKTVSTPLCEIMTRKGTDKATWHNYTKFYHSIFKDIKDKSLRIFELGIGSNNVNLASNMDDDGKAGASLYGWEEYFPNSKVYGADIDSDILFNTDRIKTFFCDQTNPHIIKYMWKNDELKEGFDIIIDDGLHTFNANVCFFENSIHKLSENGYYIIEDIHYSEIKLFNSKINEWRKKYLDLSFTLLEIEHLNNNIDNNLLVIKKISIEDIDLFSLIKDELKPKPKIRLHMLGLPHTITNNSFSSCAFTGKILRFSPMMQSLGYEVYHYGNEGSESGADKHFDILNRTEWNNLRFESYKTLKPELTDDEIHMKLNNSNTMYGELSVINSPIHIEFNKRLNKLLQKNYRSKSTDIVCLPFGKTHLSALANLDILYVESGIGYYNSFHNYRIYETYAHMHTGLAERTPKSVIGDNYWFVIPNYYNIIEWPLNLNPDNTVVGYFGRLIVNKGMNVIYSIAKCFPNITFILHGQGNLTFNTSLPNIIIKGALSGIERANFLNSIVALLSPTQYVEPFGGSAVEAQLCGTPVLTTDYGAFTETVEQFKTGLRCHTLADYCLGIQMAIDGKFDRQYIHDRAVKKYDMYNVAKEYDYAFKNILDLHNNNGGWYSKESHLSISNEFSEANFHLQNKPQEHIIEDSKNNKVVPSKKDKKRFLVFMSDNRKLEESLDTAGYNSLTASINYQYCKKHGYDFIYYIPYLEDKDKGDVLNCKSPTTNNLRHASWSKLLSTKISLELDYDYVVYIDTDCIFKDFNMTLENFIKHYSNNDILFLNNKTTTIMYWDSLMPCAGFYICKVNDKSKEFIKDWYNFNITENDIEHPWEQNALWKIYTNYNIGVIDKIMFYEEEHQFLRHVASFDSNNRLPYFTYFIESNNINYKKSISEIKVVEFDTNVI